MSAPISNSDWIVTGNEVVAWINDLELFDITFDGRTQRFALRINNVALAQTVFLGFSDSLSEAMQRARTHIGNTETAAEIAAAFGLDPESEEIDQLHCTHGRTMVEHCSECAEDTA